MTTLAILTFTLFAVSLGMLWMTHRQRQRTEQAVSALPVAGPATSHQAEQLELILKGAQIGTWVWNVPKNAVTWSSNVESILGLLPGTFQQSYDAYLALIHPEDISDFEQTLGDALAQGKDFEIEHRIKTDRRTEERWLHCRGSVELGPEHTPLRMSGTVADITERKRAEARLVTSEEKFSKAFESSPDAITLSRLPDGHFIDVNTGFCQISGYSKKEALGKSWRELDLWPSEKESTRFAQVLQTEKRVREMEMHIRNRFGQLRAMLLSAEILYIGHTPHLMIVSRDITEHKEADEERERLIAELESKNAELERYTYTVSHDLKSPLVTIKGFLGLLEEDVEKGNVAAIERDITFINRAADRMQHLLDDLLALSRIGRIVNPKEQVSLYEVAHEAVDLVTGQIHARGVEIAIDPSLPNVYGDRPRLLEVCQNLISNAVKFMGDQPVPTVILGTYEAEGQLVCYVRDNGIGIDPQYADKVFGLFERLDSDVEGTGIGLALVKRIIEIHGGHIWVESEGEGHGTTFCFILPSQPHVEIA